MNNQTLMNFKTYLIILSCLILSLSCSSDDSGELNADRNECKITEGISPNEDGLNDNFDLTCLADRTGIATLEIFDRNGRKIYEKDNYRDEFIGESDNGNSLVTGTYFYEIAFEIEDLEYGFSTKGALYINVEQ
ncbi:gliding motility-associated C-terminal domain-containing protein [Psychroflexus torquis]|uniref:T9SS type B sorting domain-containing protein n=1 Tax=Psychroflexus torquis TaxID=57029 RepID=UPI0000D52AC7|nr:gliding motility-associated C-terminal domain-containing protein [Psychroflexus torquis]